MSTPVEHVKGLNRNQTLLFPPTLDEYISQENEVRVIDAFVDTLNLQKLGFTHATLNTEGRPSYDPADLLKLYIYGMLNTTRSSRKLQNECHRNLEVMWLTKKLTPDWKTIADFRKDNAHLIKAVFKEFVELCKQLGLYGAQIASIDGSKFKAVNSRNRNLDKETLSKLQSQADAKIDQYLKALDENDKIEDTQSKAETQQSLSEKIAHLKEAKAFYEKARAQMEQSGQTQISLTDPDSKLMKVRGNRFDVCYNVQASVDAKHHLIVDYEVTNNPVDKTQLSKDAENAKRTLGVATLKVLSDKGYYTEKDVADCEKEGLTVYMPIPAVHHTSKAGVPAPEFTTGRFVYDSGKDVYVCPGGQELRFWACGAHGIGRLYRTRACESCVLRASCTNDVRGRVIVRSDYADSVDRLRVRLDTVEGKRMIGLRRELSEHPFGTLKRAFNCGYFLLKGLGKVDGEMGFSALAYNMRRAINILGVAFLISAIKAMKPQGSIVR